MSGENLPKFSCYFPNHKLVFLQVLHHSSVSWKITPLYFFSLNIISFSQKHAIKMHIFETFECTGLNLPNFSCQVWNDRSIPLQILQQSSVSWDIIPLYFFSWNFTYFQQKEPIKVQIWWNLTLAVESLKCCTSIGSFCPNHIKFQLKRYRRVISHDTVEWCRV